MKIKIKVKNILKISLISLFIILILVPYATIEIAKYLDGKGSDKAEIFYESYLAKAIKPQNDEALYKYAVNLVGDTDKYTIMLRSSGGPGANATLEGMDKAKDALNKILSKYSSENKYYSLAYSKIMDLNISLQQPDELLKWIEWGSENSNDEINYISDLYKAFYHYANREYDMASEVLKDYDISDSVVDRRYYFIKGEIALFQGNYDSAKRNFELGNSFNTFNTPNSDSIFGSRSYVEREYWYKEYESTLKGDYIVKGKVTFNGEPMPFVEVYVQNDNGVRVGGNDHVAITDINGEYETIGLRLGRYQIGIGLSNSILYDKVYLMQNVNFLDLLGDMEFDYSFNSPLDIASPKQGTIIEDNKFTVEWESVEGADYYVVELSTIIRNEDDIASGTIRSAIQDQTGEHRIKNTRAVFDIDKSKRSWGSLSFDGEEMVLEPYGVLGTFLPGVEHPIVVNAYDIDDNLVGSSLPINSFYESLSSVMVNGSLTEGEEFINNKKYVEAISYYENTLKENPSNEEALLYLSKIYMIGWKKSEQNFDKAIEYATRYNDIKDDNSLLFKVFGFMDHKTMRENKELVEKVLNQIPENKKDADFYMQLGRYNLSVNEFELAREAFDKIKNYMPIDNFYIDLYLEDFDIALERIKEPKLNLNRMSKLVLEESIEGLIADNINAEEYIGLKGLLEKILNGDLSNIEERELYNKLYYKISNSNIKAILNEIKLERYWDQGF